MPYYDYKCNECGKTFTRQHTFEEYDKGKPVKCPKCGTRKVQRLIGSVMAKTSKKS